MTMRHDDMPPWLNTASERVIGAAIEVHRALGPGLIERVYEEALCHELGLRGIAFARQQPIVVRYKSIQIPGQRLDLVVDDLIVVELKSTDGVAESHLAQLLSYIRSGDLPGGLLINFNVPVLSKGIRRLVNPAAARLRADPSIARSQSAVSAYLSAPSACCIPE